MDAIDNLTRLEAIGFCKVGAWELAANGPIPVLVAQADTVQLLYAFVGGREVLYVGKTVGALGKRMHGYKRPGPTQRTNMAVRAKLEESLRAGTAVDIYALCDDGTLQRGEFQISLAAGLEDSLIRKLQPAWNRLGL